MNAPAGTKRLACLGRTRADTLQAGNALQPTHAGRIKYAPAFQLFHLLSIQTESVTNLFISF